MTENFIASPDPDNIFEWFFVVFGLKDCQYEDGYYLGKLIFPKDYPWRPPAIMMITENGRFKPNAKICLSISDYHPESWNPVWPVKSIIIGLISFMTTDLDTVGSIKMEPEKVKAIAKKSSQELMKHKKFNEIFEDYFINIGILDAISRNSEEEKKVEEAKQQEKSL